MGSLHSETAYPSTIELKISYGRLGKKATSFPKTGVSCGVALMTGVLGLMPFRGEYDPDG